MVWKSTAVRDRFWPFPSPPSSAEPIRCIRGGAKTLASHANQPSATAAGATAAARASAPSVASEDRACERAAEVASSAEDAAADDADATAVKRNSKRAEPAAAAS